MENEHGIVLEKSWKMIILMKTFTTTLSHNLNLCPEVIGHTGGEVHLPIAPLFYPASIMSGMEVHFSTSAKSLYV